MASRRALECVGVFEGPVGFRCEVAGITRT